MLAVGLDLWTRSRAGGGALPATGGAALLADETNGFATDFTYATDAQRVAVKTGGSVVASGLSFYTRSGSVKWVYDVTGALISVGATTIPVDYDPVTHVARGMVVEPAATNLLLNNATLSTQSVTVTAVAYTLSFWGTGTITLSGTSTAGPLVGTGASNRVSLTFTPTAGSLTLMVTGTVSNAQLETGSSATTLIPTLGATATRAADNCTFLLSAIPALGSEYSIYCRYSTPAVSSTRFAAVLTDGTANEFVGFRSNTAQTALQMTDGGVIQVNANVGGSLVANVPTSAAARIKLNDTAYSGNGAAATVDTACTLPTVTEIRFGNGGNNVAAFAEFRIEKLIIVPRGWSNAELAVRSAT